MILPDMILKLFQGIFTSLTVAFNPLGSRKTIENPIRRFLSLGECDVAVAMGPMYSRKVRLAGTNG